MHIGKQRRQGRGQLPLWFNVAPCSVSGMDVDEGDATLNPNEPHESFERARASAHVLLDALEGANERNSLVGAIAAARELLVYIDEMILDDQTEDARERTELGVRMWDALTDFVQRFEGRRRPRSPPPPSKAMPMGKNMGKGKDKGLHDGQHGNSKGKHGKGTAAHQPF